MTELKFHLGDPSLTLLHRAGLAGLWMTLKQLEKETSLTQRLGSLNWELTPREIHLKWEGNDLEVLDWLLRESFQLDDGLISLRGLDSKSMRKDSQVIIHEGILGTFLQHNKTHKAIGKKVQSFILDEDKPPIITEYKALESYACQDFAEKLCDNKGKLLKKPINISGWLYPGAATRHAAFTSDTSFEESPQLAFVLLYALVACCYYILRSRLRDKRAEYALVIPEITNMETYANYRMDPKLRYASYRDFHATGLGDAGLKFLTYQNIADASQTFQVSRCQVLTLGTVSWSNQQKTRTGLFTVEASYRACKNYQVCLNELPDRIAKSKQEERSFVATSFAREMIAENLARDHPWYMNFSEWVNSNKRFEQLSYEKGGLYQMVMQTEIDPRELWFIQACHEAIRFTYGRLAERTRDRGELTNFDRENTRIRTGLSRCKNAETFREFITDFWSRAGRLPTLQEHWNELMGLATDPKQWRKGRDLALLALASYKGKEKDKDLDEVDPEDEDLIEIRGLE
ncbi:MAG: type I-MYXAN CRISPR-associated Cas8a1/Cmx1 [Thermostichus sp. DG02_3_bins_51]